MNKIARKTFFVCLGVLFAGCASKSVPQDGVVTFTFLGKPYELGQMHFIVQPDLGLGEQNESEEVRPVNGDNQFEFNIKPTKEFFDEKKDGPVLNLEWRGKMDSPENVLSSMPTFSNGSNPQVNILCTILISSISMGAQGMSNSQSEPPSPEDCWVKIDDFGNGRVKGHFGATWVLVPTNKYEGPPIPNQLGSVSDGKFDVPYIKLFK